MFELRQNLITTFITALMNNAQAIKFDCIRSLVYNVSGRPVTHDEAEM